MLRTIIQGTLAVLLILVPVLLVGLNWPPRPFAPFQAARPTFSTTPLPQQLPAPVARYYRAAVGTEIPLIDSAVITARGRLRFMGITFPGRMRFTHDAGQGYRHYIEATIFGLPLMKVNERYLDGQARMVLPVGIIENEPKVDMAANLGLWGESIWLPSIFLTDPRVRWEAVDGVTARLIVPFEDTEDSFTVNFDPNTGLITHMEAMRYKEATDEQKTAWLLDVVEWTEFQGIKVPALSTVTWADEDGPWLTINVEDIAYNATVEEYIRSTGP
jgi:hypothetical protein